MPTIHLVSLGCPKNRVDSEVMLGVAQQRGYVHVSAADEAEVIVVNTCGFIGPAKRESIDIILEMAAHKETGTCRLLVVAGCLSQRYADELATELPEVDCFVGSSDVLKLGDKRGPAPIARTLYDDKTPPPPPREEREFATRERGAGRPAKRERRRLLRLRGR